MRNENVLQEYIHKNTIIELKWHKNMIFFMGMQRNYKKLYKIFYSLGSSFLDEIKICI